MSLILPHGGVHPRIDDSAFVAQNATVVGDVEIGADSTLWFGAVVRGDVMPIHIGIRSSIQDNSVVHATGGWAATWVGNHVTVGHGVILHGCSISDRVLVGMGSIIMDAAEVASDTIIGAGSLVTENARIPSGVLALGRPARPVRDLHESELARIREAAEIYVGKCREYRALDAGR